MIAVARSECQRTAVTALSPQQRVQASRDQQDCKRKFTAKLSLAANLDSCAVAVFTLATDTARGTRHYPQRHGLAM